MKTTDHNTMVISGRLHPRGHQLPGIGPFTLRVGRRGQPDIVSNWGAKFVLLGIEQPNEDDNFTLIRVLFLLPGRRTPWVAKGMPMKRARVYHRKTGELEVRIRKRFSDKQTHPLPTGQYTGSCIHDVEGGFAVFTLQAISLRKEPETQKPKTIITPGDSTFNVTLAEAQRTLSRFDGMAGGGTNAGGLRDG